MSGLLLTCAVLLLAIVPAAYAAPEFGIAAFDGLAADAGGNLVSQAGGHPALLTTWIDFNLYTDPSVGPNVPVEDVKDIIVDLPPGFVGGVAGLGQCTGTELANGNSITDTRPLCPTTSQIGLLSIRIDIGETSQVPVYNMVPPPGVPARFGANVAGNIVVLDASLVGTGSGYHVRVTASDVPQGLTINGNTFTLWGVPSDAVHDPERTCPGQPGTLGCASGAPAKAFFRTPTSCTGSAGLAETLTVDSWQHPGIARQATFLSHDVPGYPLAPAGWGPEHGTDGCESVPFDPRFISQPPAGTHAGAPAGFSFDLTIPQSDDPKATGQSDLRKAVVTFPQGVRISPSQADGLGACSSSQIALQSNAPPSCPDSSRLGTVTIDTPLLDEPATGYVYLATPYDNPFNSLVAIYIAASVRGIVVKLPGQVALDPVTGQITTTFDDNPQLPFSRLHLELSGGPRAALVTPARCGTYFTHSVLSSWSGKTVSSDSPFTLSENAAGQGCPSAFSPSFSAGDENPVAGRFSPFSLRLTRSDTEGEFSSLSSLTLPPGLLADVSSVSTRCTDAQAAAAACPAASHIGEVTVGAGAGGNPFYVGGDVYLTNAYRGNPFGLAVVVHAVAGPFDLGYVVIRSAIQIHDDGSITTVTDPFPTILQGIPLQVRDIRVNLDRPNFIVNPTSCAPKTIAGSVLSTQNQSAALSARFEVGECASLAFKPDFRVSTAGRTSKANGASLRVHLATHEGPKATPKESNLARVDVQLPAVMPSRLTTLQKACTAAQFNADPAGCPEGSFVGTAIAHTPILQSPLSGPAVLVSHGGAAFPDLVLVLQGEGVRIDLTGHTQIKRGVTFSHFETVPDAPVQSFDLNLPQGPHSVLASNANLCASSKTVTTSRRVTRRVKGHNRKVTVRSTKTIATPLLMPTTMTAQNGAVLKQTTKIAVTGCPAAKAAKKANRSRAATRRHGRR